MSTDGTSGYGAVGSNFQLSKHEVTNAQYVDFLNAVAKADMLGLFNPQMESLTWGGIRRTGSFGNYAYEVKATAAGEGPLGTDYTYADKPVVYVSILDSMRFVNWLENGQPTGPQGPGTTEDGVYAIQNGQVGTRSPTALHFLPDENEWYKAAYHQNDGATGNYWLYPTSTDDTPNNVLADTGNSANYRHQLTGHATGNSFFPLTDVGLFDRSFSPYGTFDQGGNVWEWTESTFNPLERVIRGGSWTNLWLNMAASYRGGSDPTAELNTIGFRVARGVPEPGTSVLWVLAGVCVLAQRWGTR
jgi:formylglycine-generating enzyme required for sulfatase activity